MAKRIYIGESFNPKQVIVSEEKTITQIYRENNMEIPSTGIQLTVGTRVITDYDTPLSNYNIKDNEAVTYTKTLKGAC